MDRHEQDRDGEDCDSVIAGRDQRSIRMTAVSNLVSRPEVTDGASSNECSESNED